MTSWKLPDSGSATDRLWGDKAPNKLFYDFMVRSLSTEKQTKLIMFSGEKTARIAYSFWFLRICFRQGLAVAAGPNTAFPPLITLEGGCHEEGWPVHGCACAEPRDGVPGLPDHLGGRPALRPTLSIPGPFHDFFSLPL